MLVTIRRAAEILHVSPSHVHRMITCGRFPFYQIGPRIIRLDLEEICAAVRLQRGKTQASARAGGLV